MINLHDFSLADITPHNIAQDKNVAAIISAINPELLDVIYDLAQLDLRNNNNIDLLALLAVAFHSDDFALTDSISQKRDNVNNSLISHMKKGTEWAIIHSLQNIGLDATFLHWKNYGTPPYTFGIDGKITGDYFKTKGKDNFVRCVLDVIHENRAARSQLWHLNITLAESDNLNLYCANFSFLNGEQSLHLHRHRDFHKNFHTCIIRNIKLNLRIGISIDIMHELLCEFEKRIIAAFDERLNTLQKTIDNSHKNIDAQFNDLKDLLRWKDSTEEGINE